MAKTKRAFVVEEKEKERESPAHKKRRATKAKVRDIVRANGHEDDDELIENFEPIRRKGR
jgi:hypothetical protein